VNLRIPRAGAVLLIVTTLIGLALFIYFMSSFGGPALHLGNVYRVSADFPDTRGLAKRSEVLVRGVHVGEVDSIRLDQQTAHVTLAIESRYAPLHDDATVSVGSKTLFGESYVDLDVGTPAAPDLRSGAQLADSQVKPATPDIDQALEALNPQGRRDLTAAIDTFGRGAASPAASEQVSQTLAQLSNATTQFHAITGTLKGQEGDIAAGVQDGRTVLRALGSRESAIREIVSGGRATLGALGSRETSLREGLAQLPGLASAAQRTLHDARPLIGEARPLARDVVEAAPPLRGALLDLPATASDADKVLAGLPAFNKSAIPFLQKTGEVLNLAKPATAPLSAALRNLQPTAKYLSDRKDTFASWFSNTGDLGSSRDAKGFFARFFLFFDPTTALGLPIGNNFQNNSYTKPEDALHNQPYSGYPRLLPYNPPG
jgi:phospholipid/cholesterol/gamma-HCH transport system substrate-binding protein